MGGGHWADALEAESDAITLHVYVQPRAGRSRLVGPYDGMVKVALAAPPVDGKANAALVRWLASTLDVPRREVRIISGLSSRRKVVRVAGLTVAGVCRALDGACTTRN